MRGFFHMQLVEEISAKYCRKLADLKQYDVTLCVNCQLGMIIKSENWEISGRSNLTGGGGKGYFPHYFESQISFYDIY